VKLVAFKRYADSHNTGVFISVETLHEKNTEKLGSKV
jgi:hypothetical protein